jgi:hypothetical protein
MMVCERDEWVENDFLSEGRTCWERSGKQKEMKICQNFD